MKEQKNAPVGSVVERICSNGARTAGTTCSGVSGMSRATQGRPPCTCLKCHEPFHHLLSQLLRARHRV